MLVFSDNPRPGAEEAKLKENNINMPSVDTSILDIKASKNPMINIKLSLANLNKMPRYVIIAAQYLSAGGIKPIFKQEAT